MTTRSSGSDVITRSSSSVGTRRGGNSGGRGGNMVGGFVTELIRPPVGQRTWRTSGLRATERPIGAIPCILVDRSDWGKASGRDRGPRPHLADSPSPGFPVFGPARDQFTIRVRQGISALPDWGS